MKTGDRIQVSQQESYFDHEQLVTDLFWIYARVLQVVDDKNLLVEITHPANREHGIQKMVTVDQCRTKADVAALAKAAGKPELKKHFQIQADRLT